MFEWVTREKIEIETGLNKRQIEARRHSGIWVSGVHYKKFEDGVIWYNVKKIKEWQNIQAA